MKYYLIVWLSSGFFAVQFTLEKLMKLSLSLSIRRLFFIVQTFLLFAYIFLLLIYRIEKNRKKRQKRKRMKQKDFLPVNKKGHHQTSNFKWQNTAI